MEEIRAAVGDYQGHPDGILGAAHRHASLLTQALRYVDEEKQLQIRGAVHREKVVRYNTTSRGALWFRLCITLGPTIVAKSCELSATPVLPIAYTAARNGAIWSLLSENKQEIDPVRLIEAYSCAIEELAQIDSIMQNAWRSAECLIQSSKGRTMSDIMHHVFQHGHITVAQITRAHKISPQAAHYQITKLIEHGVIERYTSGKDGGHYVLKCLLQEFVYYYDLLLYDQSFFPVKQYLPLQ